MQILHHLAVLKMVRYFLFKRVLFEQITSPSVFWNSLGPSPSKSPGKVKKVPMRAVKCVALLAFGISHLRLGS